MDSLDKIIMQEANTVTSDEYKRLTGTSLEESMERMKAHMAEVKARVARDSKAEPKKPNENVMMMPQANMWQAMPMAAATPRNKVKKPKK